MSNVPEPSSGATEESPNTESDKSIDDLLNDLAKYFIDKGYDAGLTEGAIEYPRFAEYKKIYRTSEELYSLLMEVIGEDEAVVNVTLTLPDDVKLYLTDNRGEREQTRNDLRAEQRQKLNQLFKEIE